MPLTFAIKDITLDLRAHVEFAKSEIRIRPAGATDAEASVFHLVFAAITRPMIEENSAALGADDPEDPSIDEMQGDGLSEDDRRQLEWIGVHTVGQLRDNIEARGGGKTVQRVTGLPVTRLRAALERASAPLVEHVTAVDRQPGDAAEPPLIRLRGRNLLGGGQRPRVTLNGEAMAVVSASNRELLLAPQSHQWMGELAVIPSSGPAAAVAFDLTPFAPLPRPGGVA
jgi:hypothetical protein